MRSRRISWIVAWTVALAALTSGLLASARARADGGSLPDFVGTWHVLIHYQMPGGPHPERWKWDERVWVIEPADDGLEWIEHAIVSFSDPSGRFENLGTNRARRLLGAWEPSAEQLGEIAEGLAVSSRGMRRKHLRRISPGLWQSESAENTLGRSSSGLGYNEVWSIRQRDGETRFRLDTRFAVSAAAGDESGGATVYLAEGGRPFHGRYDYAGERIGRFRMRPTHILIPDDDDPLDASSRPTPLEHGLLELIPDRKVHADVPLLMTVLRPFHYFSERRLVIDSTPPGAELDLAYLRRGTQLMYKRGRAPLEVVLPTRLQSAPADRILVRGFVPGHERTHESVDVSEVGDELLLELPPLENQLTGVAHGSLAGRSVLELRTRELPTVRVAEDERGWTIVLVRTGLRPALSARLSALRDPQLSFDARQLGNDLVVRVDAGGRQDVELRYRSLEDPVRGGARSRFEIDGPTASGRTQRLLAAVGGMTTAPGGCDGRYEDALRGELTLRDLGSLLGREDHPYRATLRAALRGLAQARDGHLRTRAGDPLSADTPLEFELAWSRSAEIDGYLVWLHDLAGRIDRSDDGALAFRSLVAPDWTPKRFSELLETAASARERCLHGALSRHDGTAPRSRER